MYTLKLSTKEIVTLQLSLCIAAQIYKIFPETYAEELEVIENLILKSYSAEYIPEED